MTVLGAFQLVRMESKEHGIYYILNEVFTSSKEKPRQFLIPNLIEVNSQ